MTTLKKFKMYVAYQIPMTQMAMLTTGFQTY